MFSKRLLQPGVVVSSFFLIAAAPISHFYNRTSNTITSIAPGDSLQPAFHKFDASGFCSCMYCLSSDDIKKIPRIKLRKTTAIFVQRYLLKNDYYLNKLKLKAAKYFPVIEKVFSQQGLPSELKYLAIVESQLNNKVVSYAGAVGLWQLMPGAAKKFGLKTGRKNDERTNVYKSTTAAGKYLSEMYEYFDDWLLTVAAYNAGIGNVLSAIKKSGSREYWVLERFLPKETRLYVQRFIAIHYYFEGHGSFVTMTKKEIEEHINAMKRLAKEKEEIALTGNSVIAQSSNHDLCKRK